MRGHELTNNKTMTKTKTETMTNTFREHLQRAILETCDLWDIWSEWWGDTTWPTKILWQRQRQRQWQWQRQRLRYMGTVHWALWASNNSLTQFGAPAPEWVILAGWKGTQGQMPSYMRTDLECLWELYQPDRMKLLVAGLFWKGDLEHLLKPKAAPNHFWLLLPFRLHITNTVHNGASQNWPEYFKEANFYACRHHVGIM